MIAHEKVLIINSHGPSSGATKLHRGIGLTPYDNVDSRRSHRKRFNNKVEKKLKKKQELSASTPTDTTTQ